MILDIAMAETTPPPSTAASTSPDAKANTEILPSSSYSQGPIGGRGGRSGRDGRGSMPVSLVQETTEHTMPEAASEVEPALSPRSPPIPSGRLGGRGGRSGRGSMTRSSEERHVA